MMDRIETSPCYKYNNKRRKGPKGCRIVPVITSTYCKVQLQVVSDIPHVLAKEFGLCCERQPKPPTLCACVRVILVCCMLCVVLCQSSDFAQQYEVVTPEE